MRTTIGDVIPDRMLVFAILVLALVIWWAFASGQSTQQRQLAERRYELENWEFEKWDDPFCHTWKANFPTMRLHYEFKVMDDVGSDSKCEYLLRRSPSGQWEFQLTHESWMERVKELRERISG